MVWPRELREAVQEVVGGVAEEGKAGKYDSQYEDCPSVSKVRWTDYSPFPCKNSVQSYPHPHQSHV